MSQKNTMISITWQFFSVVVVVVLFKEWQAAAWRKICSSLGLNVEQKNYDRVSVFSRVQRRTYRCCISQVDYPDSKRIASIIGWVSVVRWWICLLIAATEWKHHYKDISILRICAVFIFRDTECTVRDLISDPAEPVLCPERELQKAQEEYMQMFEEDIFDYDDEDYLGWKASKLSAFGIDADELQRQTE